MTLEDLQKQVDNWIKTFGVKYFDEMTNTVLLSEEMGEFSRLIARQYGQQSFKKGVDTSNIKEQIADEMADIIFVLTCLANQMDINLSDAILKNLDKKTKRDHSRHFENDKLKE